jgi:hypothetical protein
MQAFVYGRDAAAPAGNKARYLETLRQHEAAVRAHFADRPDDLLVMNLEAGDGWRELCAFLGAPVPAEPFPTRNKASDRKALLFRVRRKLLRVVGRYLAPEAI